MGQNKAGAVKARAALVARFGGEEAYLEWMRRMGAKGGRNGHTGGFAANRELARVAGAKGGRISRRKKVAER